MKAADIVGKRVASIDQERMPYEPYRTGERLYHLHSITFTDGTVLRLVALESEFEPFVHAAVNKPKGESHDHE